MKRFSLFFSMFTFMLVVAVNGSYAGATKPAKPPQPDPLSGKVMESINGGGFTYVHIEKGDKKIWVAVPEMKVAVGQEISFQPGMTMNNFTSLFEVKNCPTNGGKLIHLQDGSGDPSKETNDIVVTSQELPAVGDTVTARGALSKDKDLGFGYNYLVIVEQASIKK